ncbi:hypothetical protein Anas_04283 [Armadillidium nasatum]|uniref:Uncharacterized protein n=1 Tax=Armadillidium nasatum TaxID=96803 RepID=A0A5N5TLW1_9CRUS|nr:hypothetical protein Anas_04283 [Armadillidium nasatum]
MLTIKVIQRNRIKLDVTLENIQRVTASKSPSKGRHSSIDFGKEHMPRFDNKMKIEDNPEIFFLCLPLSIVLFSALYIKRLDVPANFYLLVAFTIVEAVTVGVFVSLYDVASFIQALILTTIIVDPSAIDAELKFSDSSPEPLHSIFCHIILKWFEYGIQMNVPTIKKHVIVCPTRCALPVFLNELQKWLHYSFSDNTTKFFKKNLDGIYTRIDITKESQLMKSQRNEKSENFDIIVTSRNEKEWRTILFEKDILELNNQVHKGSKNKKFDSHIVTHHSSFEQAGSENGAINSGYVSSPTAPHGPNYSDAIPISQSHPLFKYREVSTSNSIFIHRQLFFLATLRDE